MNDMSRPVFMTIPVDRGTNFCSRARSPCHHCDRRARREKWDIFSENSIVESFVGKMLIFEPFQSAASFLAIKSLYSYLFQGYFDVLLFSLNCFSFLPSPPPIPDLCYDVFVREKKPRIDNSVYLPFYLPVCL